ncbi:MAG: nucleotidyltransferase family protein [Planctomycetota bacterium]|nr:nucleotidyltransferase family protein [Planctomycetota bacterium]MDA1113002.1 nucleotidyltransferase family protein [Planctomycetota bacterium]
MPGSTYPVDAILLAAGSGRRLGLPKAFLELNGTWMLPRLVDALFTGGCRSVHVIVRGQDVEKLEQRMSWDRANLVINPSPDAGRTGSVLCGLEAINEPDAVMIHSCDIPLLSSDAVHQLIHGWHKCDAPDSVLARLTTPGGKGGHPLLLGAEHVSKLRAFHADQPLRQLLRDTPDAVLNLVRRGDPGPFLDVDTREQLELLESFF